MTAFTGKILLFLMTCLGEKAQAQNSFAIVQPFPESVYPIEGTSAQVTCVAFDSSGVKTPDRIQFVRKDKYAVITNITATENIYFTKKVEELVSQDGKKLKKLFVTMHINNTKLADDSQMGSLGRYECHAFAVGDSTVVKHGFSVNVIRKTEIPRVSVSKTGVMQRGDSFTIDCNVTEGQGRATRLKKISWFKNGVREKSVENPNPNDPQDSLGPIVIRNATAKDGGNYTCLLEVLLRYVKEHNVSDSSIIRIADNFGIVEPFPENIYQIEGTSAQVTCVAFDSLGVKTPDRIQFVRKDKFGTYTNIATANIYFTSKIEELVDQDGKKLKKLVVTMHIKNLTQYDDSQYGPLGKYECHAFAVGDSTVRKHGFSVNVIRKTEIPRVSVSKTGVLQHGDSFTIDCNFTKGQGGVYGLKRISWYKDGVRKKSVQNPDPRDPQDSLGPLVIRNAIAKDGGNYTCLVEVLLRYVKEHNVSDSSIIRIAPWFDKPKGDLEFDKFKGDNVSFECAAQGYPYVEWKVQKQDEDTAKSCINEPDGNYRIQGNGIYSPHVLTVSNLQYTDSGSYYCCLPSNCSNNIEDNCQRFVLGVRVPDWLDQPKEDLEFEKYKGDSVSFVCVAQGFSQVEWKVLKQGEETVESCINESDSSYHIQKRRVFGCTVLYLHVLTLSDLQYNDRGSYYCCHPSNSLHDVKDNCQRFVLEVKEMEKIGSQPGLTGLSRKYIAGIIAGVIGLIGVVLVIVTTILAKRRGCCKGAVETKNVNESFQVECAENPYSEEPV